MWKNKPFVLGYLPYTVCYTSLAVHYITWTKLVATTSWKRLNLWKCEPHTKTFIELLCRILHTHQTLPGKRSPKPVFKDMLPAVLQKSTITRSSWTLPWAAEFWDQWLPQMASVCGLLLHKARYMDDLATRMILQLHCYACDIHMLTLLISKQPSYFQKNFAFPVSFQQNIVKNSGYSLPSWSDDVWRIPEIANTKIKLEINLQVWS